MSYITAGAVYTFGVYELNNTILTTTVVDQFIIDAEAFVNGKLSKLYSVPFTSTGIPDLVKTITRDIAGYYCMKFLYEYQNRNISNYVSERYRNAMQVLDDLYQNKIGLVGSLSAGGVGVIPINTSISLKATYSSVPLIVNMDDPLTWRASSTLLDAIDAEREVAG